MSFTSAESKQYNRHLILEDIGPVGQQKLKSANILVIGAGGLGCPILQYLTAAGVGHIGIIDNDQVDQSNLQRQVLYSHSDIGLLKVEAAIKRLSALNPFIKFTAYPEKLTADNALSIFKNYDVIIDGSDNFPTRYLANDAAVLTKKPLVFGSIYKFEGQVTVFNYQHGPTYRCLFPNPPKPDEVPNCSQIGVLGILPGIIGCFQANEALKIILGIGEVLSGKLLTYNTLNNTQYLIDFEITEQAKVETLTDDYDFFCGITIPEQEHEKTYQSVKANLNDYYLIDVREAWEREEGHIGGKHISVYELPNRLQEIETERPILVYCQSGSRGQLAVTLLKARFPDALIYNLSGGLSSTN